MGGKVLTNVAAACQIDVVAGIDVGGTKKGFHLVLLQGSAITCVASSLDAANFTSAVCSSKYCRWHRCAFAMGSRRHWSGSGARNGTGANLVLHHPDA